MTQYMSPGTLDRAPLPVLVAVAPPARQSRITVAFRLLLAIPHLIVLYVLGVVGGVLLVIGWFAALFTGQLPPFCASFLTGYLRWYFRVAAYLLLLTDVYPPFTLDDSGYPVRLAVQPGRLNRLAVLFRIVLAIPAWVLAVLLGYGIGTIVVFIAWLITLVAGRLPGSLHHAFAAALRFLARFLGYLYLVTATYPGGLFGDRDPSGAAGVPGYAAGPSFGAGPGYGGQPEPGYSAGPGYGGQPEPGYSGAAGYGTAAGYDSGPGFSVADDSPAGFGQPIASQPFSQPVVNIPDQWRLTLGGRAKGLLVVFIVLGAVTLAAGGALAGAGAATAVNNAVAADQVTTAFNKLNNQLNTIETTENACGQSATALPCIQAVVKKMSADITTFAGSVQHVSVPSGGRSDQAKLEADSTATAQILNQLSTASAAQYATIFASSSLTAHLNALATDYQDLELRLVPGGS